MIKWLIDEVLYFDTCSDLHTAPGICECIGAHPVKNENPKMSLKVSAIRGRSMAFATVSEIILVGSHKETCKLFQCERHLRSSNRESQGMSPTHNRQRLNELWIYSSAILTISSWRLSGPRHKTRDFDQIYWLCSPLKGLFIYYLWLNDNNLRRMFLLSAVFHHGAACRN